MYLLTKKNSKKSEAREQLFAKMIKNGYSSTEILEYKNLLPEILPPKTMLNLGETLRNMLAALCLKAKINGITIFSDVEGEGSFLVSSLYLFSLAELLVNAARYACDGIVNNSIKISMSQVVAFISYNGKTLPNLPRGVTAKVGSGRVEICCYSVLTETKEGRSIELWEFFLDRLSAVNLALQEV